ncbi:putative DNA helicase [Campylobacter subantarcticus LMG 24377]|uniref:DNA helicase n=1 Tax=Campylobacter subantarcticus TaxID=497724 RepID=A0ABW9N588_9BACT|nr:cory-CC-star protein [Campylobacter subantarcticus]AJC93145.1 putative DNA helicase [Campylobacter subantarcticus LMG 24377]EAL3938715.1 DNA helicase [Campylobacter lari]EAL3939842.1 DNA helicase [Campylobacter lari]MPB99445.1 DNA helicase [Campylobacter subantarcticus]
MNVFHSFSKKLEEFYFSKYGKAIKKEQEEIDDFFMIITFSELMGIENPFMLYTLELIPTLSPKFHKWHTKMGLKHSVFDNFPCSCCC